MKVNSSKSTKRKADCTKQKFPCNKCKQLGHWAAECPQKQQHAENRRGKLATKMNADASPAHALGASRASIVDAENWYCDSGATPRRTNIILCHTQNLPILEQSYLARKMC